MNDKGLEPMLYVGEGVFVCKCEYAQAFSPITFTVCNLVVDSMYSDVRIFSCQFHGCILSNYRTWVLLFMKPHFICAILYGAKLVCDGKKL